ncbi:MAG TPA: DUF6311 domain-containing protein, partial [Polyangiaceae bacterium]|nr:DUF6311 domain-containing protein [Polyangiaceae bacterium]
MAIPLLLGALSFFVLAGGGLLRPTNIRWLQHGDPATYYLGWLFYRNSPWQLPLGLNPRYGLEIGSSIMFTDNIPLFAFVFKAFSRLLPEPFQYFGLWLLGCFMLQAWFAWKLLGILTSKTALRAGGSLLFLLAPPFLWRLQGHYAMLDQWSLLAALYLCLGSRTTARGASWPILALTVSLVHSYTTAMVLGLWLTDVFRRIVWPGRTRADWLQLVLVPGAALFGFWQAGFFATGRGVDAEGFGRYRMNLTSLIDASGWSYLLPDIPERAGDYEGFVFLGLGGILLALVSLPALRGAPAALRKKREYWPLLVALVAFTLFACSNRIGFATHELVIPLPKSLIERANLLRSSGRMFWPVYYALFWVMIRGLIKLYSTRVASALMLTIVLLQAVDTSAGWLPIRRDLQLSGSTWDTPLRSAFWSQASRQYTELRMVPPRNQAPGYAPLAYYAGTHGMGTNAIYLARVDLDRLNAATRAADRTIRLAHFDERSLLILDPRYL